jgi:hypothetical protein
VFRGMGNSANASAGTPDNVYSMYDSPLASTAL